MNCFVSAVAMGKTKGQSALLSCGRVSGHGRICLSLATLVVAHVSLVSFSAEREAQCDSCVIRLSS